MWGVIFTALLNHLLTRAFNVELLSKFGADAWKLQGILLEEQVKDLERAIAHVKAQTLQINRERKAEQTQAKKEIDALEGEWIELINSVS